MVRHHKLVHHFLHFTLSSDVDAPYTHIYQQKTLIITDKFNLIYFIKKIKRIKPISDIVYLDGYLFIINMNLSGDFFQSVP
jgi:hypothetical protein